jgi:hypothetical protein
MISKNIAIDGVNDAVADLKAGTVIRSVISFPEATSSPTAGEGAGTATTT